MRIIIVGADGSIGSALAAAFSQRENVVYTTTRRKVSMGHRAIHLDLASMDPENDDMPAVDVAFFCAAVTSFYECRSNPALARQVNVIGPTSLARRLVSAGTRVVLLSTSAVFDWSVPHVSATVPRCPLTVYGELKAEVEKEFEALGAKASIVRFSKILTPNSNLIVSWIESLCRGRPVTAFVDHHMAPVSLDDAVAALLALAADGGGGTYQVSAKDDVSYYQCACHIASRLGIDSALVHPGDAREAGIPPEEIIRFSSLDTSRMTIITGRPPPDPYAVIDAVYGHRYAAARTGLAT